MRSAREIADAIVHRRTEEVLRCPHCGRSSRWSAVGDDKIRCNECDDVTPRRDWASGRVDARAVYLRDGIAEAVESAVAEVRAEERAQYEAKINTPMVTDFCASVVNEAAHQRERWGPDHDAGKSDDDWFWTLAFLATKAKENVRGKRKHHIVACGALLLNWLETESRAQVPKAQA